MGLTGGGSGAIAALLQTPGASASVLEVNVPYSPTALQQWLGGSVDQYCNERTARAMAMRAFMRSRSLSDADVQSLRGIGVTASLATNRPKHGEHRIHMAWQSASKTVVTSCTFPTVHDARAPEELLSTRLILAIIAEACGVAGASEIGSASPRVIRNEQQARTEWSQLLLGQRDYVAINSATEVDSKNMPRVLFPGAFNPLHWGHEKMAAIAEQHCHLPATFELSITNVDKPPLDFIEIASRLNGLRNKPLLLTHAPTFVEKARLAPGCTFVVGVDTIGRIGDPVYYQNDLSKRDAAIEELRHLGCRFLAFGRRANDQFANLTSFDIPPSLRALCDEVPESEFDANISSTQLRQT